MQREREKTVWFYITILFHWNCRQIYNSMQKISPVCISLDVACEKKLLILLGILEKLFLSLLSSLFARISSHCKFIIKMSLTLPYVCATITFYYALLFMFIVSPFYELLLLQIKKLNLIRFLLFINGCWWEVCDVKLFKFSKSFGR